MPTGQFTVQYGEDTREYAPVDNTKPNPLYGKISPANAVAMVEAGDTSLLDEAGSLAAIAGDWLWGTLQGDFNENPSTSQIVVGSIISMIPVIDQIMDCRDVCANVMVLTDDDKANDTNGWIALTLTGIGFIPVLGSAVKGVGKVIVKNAEGAISLAAATLRKLGKGDPIAYIKNIDWQDLGKQAAALIKEKVEALREALTAITSSYKLKWLLSDDMLANLKQVNESLAAIIPKIEQGIARATNLLETKAKQAIKAYEGELPHTGRTGTVKNTKTKELEVSQKNELKGTKVKRNLNSSKVRKALFKQYDITIGSYKDMKKITKEGYQREHFLPHSNFMTRSKMSKEARSNVPINKDFGDYNENDAITYFVFDDQSKGTEHRYLTDVEKQYAKLLQDKGEFATVTQWLDHMEAQTAISLSMDTIARAPELYAAKVPVEDAGDVAKAIRIEAENYLDSAGVNKNAPMSNLVGGGDAVGNDKVTKIEDF